MEKIRKAVTDRQADRQAGRQAGRQTDRQTDRRDRSELLGHSEKLHRTLFFDSCECVCSSNYWCKTTCWQWVLTKASIPFFLVELYEFFNLEQLSIVLISLLEMLKDMINSHICMLLSKSLEAGDISPKWKLFSYIWIIKFTVINPAKWWHQCHFITDSKFEFEYNST